MTDQETKEQPISVTDVRKTSPDGAPTDSAYRQWLDELAEAERLELFWEFQVRLKALDRFLHPISGKHTLLSDPTHHEYSNELAIVNRTLQRLLHLGQRLIEVEDPSILYFQNFIEKSLLSDYRRDVLFGQRVQEVTPREGFFHLLSALQHLLQVSKSMKEVNFVTQNLFVSLGYLFKHVSVGNRRFDPFINHELSGRFDRVNHPVITQAIRSLMNEQDRKAASMMLLWFSRVLRYLRFVDPNREELTDLLDYLPIFSLIQSDVMLMTPNIEDTIRKDLYGDKPRTEIGQSLLDVADAVAFQLQLEGRKVFQQVLADVSNIRNFGILRAEVETAHGILQNFFQQAVVWVIQAIYPDTLGRDIFYDFVSRKERSIRLRDDIYIFMKLVGQAESIISDPEQEQHWTDMLDAVRNFIGYFESISFAYVRYSEHDTFRGFFEVIHSADAEDLAIELQRAELQRELHKFRLFLETTLGQIGQRQELQATPLDEDAAQETLEQFLP